jgi:purine-binding chemotaxis protein CheW
MSLFNNDKNRSSDSKRYLEFYLGKESYAVSLLKVKEVITPPEITPIPKSPAYVCGLINLRGLVLTVIDLRKKLGIVPNPNAQTAVIIFDLDDRMVGVVVDSIQKVLNVNEDCVKPVPDQDNGSTSHLLGILQHDNILTMWLDPNLLLESQHRAAA